MPHDLAFVVVNTPDDYWIRRRIYEEKGYKVTDERAYRSIKIDTQDYNAEDLTIERYHAFLATKQD